VAFVAGSRGAFRSGAATSRRSKPRRRIVAVDEVLEALAALDGEPRRLKSISRIAMAA
jgi:hypothetical protein